MDVLIICLLVVVLLYVVLRFITPTSNAPSPPALPVLGHLIQVLKNYDRFNDWLLELSNQYGGTYKLWIPGQPEIVVSVDPESVDHVLKRNFDNYEKGNYFKTRFNELLGVGIFNSDGKEWTVQRKAASWLFAAASFRDFMLQIFVQHGVEVRELLASHATSGKSIDAQSLFASFTMDSIGSIGFGVDTNCVAAMKENAQQPEFARAFDNAQFIIAKRFMLPFLAIRRKLAKEETQVFPTMVNCVRERVGEVIAERKQNMADLETKQDLLSRFMLLTNENNEPYTEKELEDIVLNFMIAGRDTTSNALAWTQYRLMEFPEWADKLDDEISDALATEGLGTADQIGTDTDMQKLFTVIDKKLPNLHAFCYEVLRLHPSVPRDGKSCIKDDVLPNGITVRKGSTFIYCPYAMNRTEALFPNATKFDPERWLENGKVKRLQTNVYAVFNHGPRLCLGKDMALLEMKSLLVMLLPLFRMTRVGANKHPQYMTTITLPMKEPLQVTVTAKGK